MNKKQPSFPFYHSDYLGSGFVQELSRAEEYVYFRCLINCGGQGSIPSDLKGISALCKSLPLNQLKPIWDKIAWRFEPHPTLPGRLINLRMEEAKAFKERFLEKQRVNGEKGGRPRNPKANPDETQAVSHSKASNKPKQNPKETQQVTQTITQTKPSPSYSLSHSPVSITNNSNTVGFVRPIERTGGRAVIDPSGEKLQSQWGAVEGSIRKNVEPESFAKHYAGCRVVLATSREVVLAVPQALIDRNGNAETAALVLLLTIKNSGVELMRDRALRVVSLDDVEVEP